MSFFKDVFSQLQSEVKDLADGSEDIVSLGSKITKHARAEVIGRLNPNRRHDSDAEKRNDEIRKEINDSHRFQSFAGERYHNVVKWHVDGHDYMWALSEMLENASEAIFILDWWLSPELYLRRPPAHNAKWRLDRVLKRKADQGVKIHIIVYKEVSYNSSRF